MAVINFVAMAVFDRIGCCDDGSMAVQADGDFRSGCTSYDHEWHPWALWHTSYVMPGQWRVE